MFIVYRMAISKLIACVAIATAVLGVLSDRAIAQEKSPEYKGILDCGRCHNSPSLFDKQAGIHSFVALTEAANWATLDRHAQAWNHIDPKQSPLATQIYEKLQVPIDTWKTQRQCLSCHANWLPEQQSLPPDATFGVTCESCHGPSSVWVGMHTDRNVWRVKDPAAKKTLGMIAVRHPVARAEQCYSCHIGNAKEQKVVTHAMYAAGHPPLPNVEIESFVRKMPRHWRYLPEKGNFEHREEFVKLHYGSADAEKDLPQTKAVVVGGVVALRCYLQLLGAQETGESQSELRWPELAVYDCSGCHHELKSPSWRQLRSDFGRGRPRMLEWPALIAERVSLPLLNDEAASMEFNRRMTNLRELLTLRPFGPPGTGKHSLSADAQAFADWLKSIEEQLAKKSYNRETAEEALTNIGTAGRSELWDYYTARQLADAYRTIRLEVQAGYPQLKEEGEAPLAIAEGYLKQLNDWNCDTVAERSRQIDKQLMDQLLLEPLSLMPLADFACNKGAALEPAALKTKIWQDRAQLLENGAKYDARWFQQRFGQLTSDSPSK